MNNGYKVSGEKMGSRFIISHKESREAVKKGLELSDKEFRKQYGGINKRGAGVSRSQWKRWNRQSLRLQRVYLKSLPTHDMDGSFYENW